MFHHLGRETSSGVENLDYYTLADLFGGTGCEAEGSPASLAGDAQLTYPNIKRRTCWDSSTGNSVKCAPAPLQHSLI